MALLNASPTASLPLKALWRRTPTASLPLKALPVATALLLVLAVGFASEAAANTYRYVNDRGQTVYASTVPPQYVKNGYEVLNDRGQVIQVVPRALTGDELAAQEAARAQQLADEAAQRVQQEADNLLMRLYRSPDEIARKRDERVKLIDGQLTALLASLEKVQAEVTKLQTNVDSQVAAGKEAPSQTVETLRIQNEELARLTTQRDRLEADKAAAISEAERDMKRLSELLGTAEESATD
jgi:hypothetical protein